MIETHVILAAGRGSRLQPDLSITNYSKPLLELGGKTLLARTIECCRAAGAQAIFVVTGFNATAVSAEVNRLDDGDIETVFNPDWAGQNGLSLLVCHEMISDNFALMMSDHVFDPSILSDLVRYDVAPGSVALAIDYKVKEVFDLDDATKVVVENGRITNIGKQLENYNAIDCGLFVCAPAIFSALAEIKADRGDCSLSEGMAQIAAANKFLGFDIGPRWWQDVDTPEMMEEAQTSLAAKRISL